MKANKIREFLEYKDELDMGAGPIQANPSGHESSVMMGMC